MHPGELIYHFINTIIVAAVVSAAVLWRYRVGVVIGMRARAGVDLLPAIPPAQRVHGDAVARADVQAWETQLRWRVVAAVFAVVAICALPLGYAWFHGDTEPFLPVQVVVRSAGYWLAIVPIGVVLLAYSWRQALRFVVVALLAGAAGIVLLAVVQRIAMGRAPSLDLMTGGMAFLQIVAIEAPVAVTLFGVTGIPRVRGVAPIVFVGLLVFSLAPLFGSQVTRLLTTTRSGSDFVLRFGMSAAFVVMALPTAWMAWGRLKAVARSFETKRIAESELLARVWWIMVVAAFVIEYVNARGLSWHPFALGVAVSWAFALAYPRALRWAVPEPRPPRRTLLLLRVFGDTARTERVFDRIGARWRWFGPVTMIAAPDVVARTVDAGDFLNFVSGHLRERFVKSATDLRGGLERLDLEPDQDGRYRVNELCCQADTWQAAVVELMDRADVVLMDLSRFTERRAGCTFELQQLAARLDNRRLVLLTDDTTDRALVAANVNPGAPPRTVALASRTVTDRDVSRVWDEVLAAAYEGGAVAA